MAYLLHVDARAVRRSWAARRRHAPTAASRPPAGRRRESKVHDTWATCPSRISCTMAAARRGAPSPPTAARDLRQPRLHPVARGRVRPAAGGLRRRCAPRSSGSASARVPRRARQSGSPWNKTARPPETCQPASLRPSLCKKSPSAFPASAASTVTVPLAASARSACAMASQLSPSIALDRGTLAGVPEKTPPRRWRTPAAPNSTARSRSIRPAASIKRGQMARGFSSAAARQHCYCWTVPGQIVFPEKLVAAQRRAHQPGQRMADVGGPHALPPEEFLLERKDAQHALRVRRICFSRPCATPTPAAPPGTPPECPGGAGGAPRAGESPANPSGWPDPAFRRARPPVASGIPRRSAGCGETTSSSPTTARLAESTTVRTPAARKRGPVQPKKSASGARRAQLLRHQRSVQVARRLTRRDQDLAAHST